jgi:site-specific recombinase XerD
MSVTYIQNRRIVDDFLLYLSVYRRPATISCYDTALRVFLRWLEGEGKIITSLEIMDFPQYVAWMGKRSLKDGTKAINVTAAKSMWRWLFENGRVPFPPERIKTPERLNVESHETMTRDEFRRIIQTFSEHVPNELRGKTIVSLLYATGMRLGEMLSLDVTDIDLEKMSATVRTFKRKKHYRRVYWDPSVNELLRKWIDVRDGYARGWGNRSMALFIGMATTGKGERVGPEAVAKTFRIARKRAGLTKHLTPHSCRHGFATELADNGAKIHHLQEMLGHANVANTMVYIHSKDKEIEEEYRQCRTKELLD